MRRTYGVGVMLIAMPIIMLLSASAAAQPFYYENFYVGATTSGLEIGIVSAYENGGAFSGVFADAATISSWPGVKTAAAADSGIVFRAPGIFYPTGAMAIGKIQGGVCGMETYAAVVQNPGYLTSQDIFWSPPASWWTNAASGGAILQLDVANGSILATIADKRTDYLITAESVNGCIAIGAYALTNNLGTPVTPYFVAPCVTTLTGPCLGLTVSNGRPSGSGRSRNDIVFVDQNRTVHSIQFDIATRAFGALDSTSYATPWPLGAYGNTIAGIWIAQNNSGTFSHDVGVSIPNLTNPTTTAGTFAVLRGNGTTTINVGVGGGPISHIPSGDLSTNPPASPSWHVFGPNGAPGTGPYGWYVVTPGTPWTICAMDASGRWPVPFYWFAYAYPAGAQPNGTPLAHPGAIGVQQNPNYRKGVLWIPYTDSTGAKKFDMMEGFAFTIYAPALANTVPFTNLPGLGPSPSAGTTWTCGNIIIPDAPTNNKPSYGLYFPGE